MDQVLSFFDILQHSLVEPQRQCYCPCHFYEQIDAFTLGIGSRAQLSSLEKEATAPYFRDTFNLGSTVVRAARRLCGLRRTNQ